MDLKQMAFYYPIVTVRMYEDRDMAIFSYVRIKRDGVWYIVLCVQFTIDHTQLEKMRVDLMEEVYKIEHLFEVSLENAGSWEKDPLQVEESVRLHYVMKDPESSVWIKPFHNITYDVNMSLSLEGDQTYKMLKQ